jgi:hypothetical protein
LLWSFAALQGFAITKQADCGALATAPQTEIAAHDLKTCAIFRMPRI